jgi:hypothetical protein
MYASVIASASRAGALIATVEIGLLLLLSRVPKRTRAPLRLSIAMAVLAGIAGGVIGRGPLLDRSSHKDPLGERPGFVQATVQIIHDQPSFGFGLGSWPQVSPPYALYNPLLVANHANDNSVESPADGSISFFSVITGILAIRVFWLTLESPWGIGVMAVFAHSALGFPQQRALLLFPVLLVLALLEANHSRHALHRSKSLPTPKARQTAPRFLGQRTPYREPGYKGHAIAHSRWALPRTPERFPRYPTLDA